MVKGFALPKFSFSNQLLIDLKCREMQPAFSLSATGGRQVKCCQKMDMVGHDDAGIQFVPLTIEMTQRIEDDFRQIAFPQMALAVAIVQVVIPLVESLAAIGALQSRR